MSEQKIDTTFRDGYLGSCIFEECSKMRYELRHAEFASHSIFERTLHRLVGILVCVLLILSLSMVLKAGSLSAPQFK